MEASERERGWGRKRDREIERDRQREGEKERDRHREIGGERERERQAAATTKRTSQFQVFSQLGHYIRIVNRVIPKTCTVETPKTLCARAKPIDTDGRQN